MQLLPPHVSPYKRTPEFEAHTIPARLLDAHTTKASVWARIVVLEGRLLYRIHEPEPEVCVLEPGIVGIVEPTMRHEVQALGPVRFYVEFLR